MKVTKDGSGVYTILMTKQEAEAITPLQFMDGYSTLFVPETNKALYEHAVGQVLAQENVLAFKTEAIATTVIGDNPPGPDGKVKPSMKNLSQGVRAQNFSSSERLPTDDFEITFSFTIAAV